MKESTVGLGTMNQDTADSLAKLRDKIREVTHSMEETMGRMILCLDFDGVIHSYVSGWKGADVIPDPPVPGAFEFIREALKEFDVAIFSSRSNLPGGILAMQSWMITHSPVGFDVNSVSFPTEKPPAFVGLDDRVLTFKGEWPTIQELVEFKPWNKK